MHPAGTEIIVCPSYIVAEVKRGTATATGIARTKPAASTSRVVSGICAVFGNTDTDSDRLIPGAFKRAIAAFHSGKSRARHLFNHRSDEVPTAKILELRELSRAELPQEMKSDATILGGLLVRREYLADYYSSRVLGAVRAGAIRDMSFAFQPTDFKYTDHEGKRIREITDLDLYDTSDVVWGCNAATAATIGKAVILTTEKVQALKEKRLADIERKEKLEELRYYTKHLPKKPLTRQQWINQMRLNKAKLDAVRLGCS